ncbi:MAG: RIP metalloprotease RseP [Burkholderiales bacterium]|nr:RIP metalloprotease RseP [Burkholderiales bacterium]MDP2397495.1 RIP metalloprotease RseP [Burkholderiales bacterium]
MLTVIAFIVALSLLVVVHEFGHYWVARRCGVKVLRFSVGFGKPLWSRTMGRDGTEWVVAAIPLGGYVKMLDEREGEVPADERHRAFNRKSVWQRFAIVLAGPAANFVAAVALYWVLFVYGIPGLVPVVAAPPAGTVAAQAGFEAGETVFAVDGTRVKTWQDFRWVMLQRALDRKPVTIELTGAQGESVVRRLGFDSLASSDIEGDVLGAMGLSRQRLVLPPVIGEVTRDGAAAKAGLRGGDRIIAINGERQDTWDDVVKLVRASAGRALQFRIQRGEVDLPALDVTPDLVEEGSARFGRIGASPRMDPGLMKGMIADVSYGPLESVWRALAKTWETSIFSLRMLGKMVTGEVSMKNLSGPITIADYAGQSAQNGWIPYLLFLALISISLGVLNLLPIPLLDGGHLMYYSVEILTGKPVPDKVMEVGQQIGMMLLFALMAFALYNDINRLIGS